MSTIFDLFFSKAGLGIAKDMPKINVPELEKSKITDATCVGIEIELENCVYLAHERHPWAEKILAFTNDDSLRNNGMELITKMGCTAAQAHRLLDMMNGILKHYYGQAFEANFRTGVHIHLNFKDKTPENVWSFLALYLLFEKTLFLVSGNRCDNIHSVPLRESKNYNLGYFFGEFREGLTPKVFEKTLEDRVAVITPVGNNTKYAALNLAPLRKYGTIEVRHHKGTTNFKEVQDWLVCLLDLYNAAMQLSVKEINEIILTLNKDSFYEKLIERVFPRSIQYVLQNPLIIPDMREGVLFLKECKMLSDREATTLYNLPTAGRAKQKGLVWDNVGPERLEAQEQQPAQGAGQGQWGGFNVAQVWQEAAAPRNPAPAPRRINRAANWDLEAFIAPRPVVDEPDNAF